MSKDVKIRVDWYAFRTSLMIAAMMGAAFAVFAFVAGLAHGLPWPPRMDDFTFAMCAAFVIPTVGLLLYSGVSDYLAALQKANAVEQLPQAPPSYRERRVTGRRKAAGAACLPTPQPKRLAPPRRVRRQ